MKACFRGNYWCLHTQKTLTLTHSDGTYTHREMHTHTPALHTEREVRVCV